MDVQTLPFAIESGHVVVDGRLGGRVGRFVLDTGSGAAALTPGFAEGLELTFAERPANALGGGGAMKPMPLATTRLQLGTLEVADMRVVVLPQDPFKHEGRECAGTLGHGVFARWTVEIDFPARLLRLIEPSAFSPPAGGLSLPMQLTHRVPVVEATLRAQVGGEASSMKLVLDTGTAAFPMLLGKAAAARAGLGRVKPRVATALGVGAGGLLRGEVMRVAELGFEGFCLRNPFIGVAKDEFGFFGSGFADGTLGLGYLSRGVLTLDYSGARVFFKPSSGFAGACDYFDTCGWHIERAPEGYWAVAWVSRKGPAGEAGVRAGDRLSTIAGVSATAIDQATIDAALAGEGKLALMLRRGRHQVAIEIVRRQLI
jgi:predicted aspartyl protease